MSLIATRQNATKLRKAAQKMELQLEQKRKPAFDGLKSTPRRARIAASKAAEARTLEHIHNTLLKLAEGHENGGVPEPVAHITDRKATAYLVATLEWLERDRQNAKTYRDESYLKPVRHYFSVFGDSEVLARAGINDEEAFEMAVHAIEELLESDLQKARRKQKLEDLERSFIGTKILGYFPTPEPLARHLVELADLREGGRVLEPSAGRGNIAEVLRATSPRSTLEVIELNHTLRELLELKGFRVVGEDFLEHQNRYDRIVMNPPFEKFQDIEHVRHAYSLLEPGGRLVSVLSEAVFFRSEKKAEDFRAWLGEVGAFVERNPPDAFKASGTSVQTRTVVIQKAASSSDGEVKEVNVPPGQDA
jgi:predicted RNA methylase